MGEDVGAWDCGSIGDSLEACVWYSRTSSFMKKVSVSGKSGLGVVLSSGSSPCVAYLLLFSSSLSPSSLSLITCVESLSF